MISEDKFDFIKKLVKFCVNDDNDDLLKLIREEMANDSLLLDLVNEYDYDTDVADIVKELVTSVLNELRTYKQGVPAVG